MEPQTMEMKPLNRTSHRDLKLKRGAPYLRMEGIHSVTLAAAELPKASRHYPVLFGDTGAGLRPLALLGLVANENLYLDGGAWRAEYLPAAIRTVPFHLAGEQVLIDESSHLFGTEEGEALFDDAGEPAAALRERLAFLRECQAADMATAEWCRRLSDLGLLAERNAEVVSPRGMRYRLDGFRAVDEGRLAALPGEALAGLMRDGSLGLIYAHLLSLENLLSLARRRDDIAPAVAPPAGDAEEKPEAGEKVKRKGGK